MSVRLQIHPYRVIIQCLTQSQTYPPPGPSNQEQVPILHCHFCQSPSIEHSLIVCQTVRLQGHTVLTCSPRGQENEKKEAGETSCSRDEKNVATGPRKYTYDCQPFVFFAFPNSLCGRVKLHFAKKVEKRTVDPVSNPAISLVNTAHSLYD